MIVDLQIAPIGTSPAAGAVPAPLAEPALLFIGDLEVLSEDNRCNCNASDDNPY
ncbi:hypothetical protein [Umezawaea sp. Da 62-37]|uniref:hypothetical protein n=1 Tax=Umezawaea sp. Da 62-37 TaxID=3075927 RepID=UPI0028F6EF4E|nr:hypothetical protein [Umezawaea sp. Da 62-37]WNV82245.1 hypothetical protein RM788_29005 [Umezawaea sp. Da 62-37]